MTAMSMHDDATYVAEVEAQRDRARRDLRGPMSPLAAIARHELPVGSRLRFGPPLGGTPTAARAPDVVLAGASRAVDVRATPDGFRVDGDPCGPTQIDLGRYRLRLSHQGYPAVVILDAESARLREDVRLRWFPVDPAARVVAVLEPDPSALAIASTASADRQAERVGWVRFTLDGVACRLAVTRLREPGVRDDALDVYFRDATTGRESYPVGRYVSVVRDGDRVVVDFNLAYNPSCALSPYYNCPIPPAENRLAVPIRAGAMAPLVPAHR